MTVWVIGYRNDRYCQHDIEIYSKEAEAKKVFKEEIKWHKDEREFSYDKDNNEASWLDGDDFASISMWKQKVR